MATNNVNLKYDEIWGKTSTVIEHRSESHAIVDILVD